MISNIKLLIWNIKTKNTKDIYIDIYRSMIYKKNLEKKTILVVTKLSLSHLI